MGRNTPTKPTTSMDQARRIIGNIASPGSERPQHQTALQEVMIHAVAGVIDTVPDCRHRERSIEFLEMAFASGQCGILSSGDAIPVGSVPNVASLGATDPVVAPPEPKLTPPPNPAPDHPEDQETGEPDGELGNNDSWVDPDGEPEQEESEDDDPEGDDEEE